MVKGDRDERVNGLWGRRERMGGDEVGRLGMVSVSMDVENEMETFKEGGGGGLDRFVRGGQE